MKILKLPASDPKKFGPKRASKKQRALEKKGQLNLFNAPGRVLQLHPQSAFEEALMMDERGDINNARDLYLKAIQKKDAVADAYCNLGIIESQEDNEVEAINYLTLCLKHEPRHYEAHFNLANIYAEAGNLDLARLHYEVAIEIEPEFSNSYFNLALTLVIDHQYGEAIKVLNSYRELTSADEYKLAGDLIEKLKTMV